VYTFKRPKAGRKSIARKAPEEKLCLVGRKSVYTFNQTLEVQKANSGSP